MFDGDLSKIIDGWKRVGERSVLLQFKDAKARDDFLISLLPHSIFEENNYMGLALPLNPLFTFQSFKVLEGSKMAQLMCLAVSEKLQVLNAPVVLIGPHGCGKTHLLQAAVARRRMKDKNNTAVYTTAEQFVNLYIAATQKKQKDSFIKRVETIPLFAIDDLQFFKRKPRSAEAFVSVCQTILRQNGEILLSTSEPLIRLKHDTPALLSLLNEAIICVIEPPSTEEKKDILGLKADILGVELQEEELERIIHHTDSINEAEGLLLHYKFTKNIPKRKSIQTILRRIEEKVSITGARKPAQQILIFLLKEAGYDNAYIIRALNLKSSSSIRYAVKKVKKLLASSSLSQKILEELSKYIEESIK